MAFWRPAPRPALPPPLVRFWRHPIRWTEITLALVIVGLIAAHVGTLIIVGLYYLLFETVGSVKHVWDTLLTVQWAHLFGRQLISTATWNNDRHLLRNVFEGVLGGTLAQLIIFNHFRIRHTGKLNRLDRFEFKLHIPNVKDHRGLTGWQLLLLPALVIIYAVPGFLVGYVVTQVVKHNLTLAHSDYVFFFGDGTTGTSVWSHIQTLWTGNKDQKLIGLFASVFLARRVMKGSADDVQGFFAARRVALHKPIRRYHPPNFRARVNAMDADGVVHHYSTADALVAIVLTAAMVVGAALALFGLYVLAFIA